MKLHITISYSGGLTNAEATHLVHLMVDRQCRSFLDVLSVKRLKDSEPERDHRVLQRIFEWVQLYYRDGTLRSMIA